MQIGDRLLLSGGALTGAASLLHLGIILGGPDWYRFFGAGEHMARLAARGSIYPSVITAGIAAILGVWTLYALSGAGLIRRLPFLPLALPLIAAVYLTRGILGVPAVLLVDDPVRESAERENDVHGGQLGHLRLSWSVLRRRCRRGLEKVLCQSRLTTSRNLAEQVTSENLPAIQPARRTV